MYKCVCLLPNSTPTQSVLFNSWIYLPLRLDLLFHFHFLLRLVDPNCFDFFKIFTLPRHVCAMERLKCHNAFEVIEIWGDSAGLCLWADVSRWPSSNIVRKNSFVPGTFGVVRPGVYAAPLPTAYGPGCDLLYELSALSYVWRNAYWKLL